LEQNLRVYINYHQDDWVNLLPLAEFAIQQHFALGNMFTPFFTNKGFSPQTEVSLEPVLSDTAHQL